MSRFVWVFNGNIRVRHFNSVHKSVYCIRHFTGFVIRASRGFIVIFQIIQVHIIISNIGKEVQSHIFFF